MLTSAPRLNVLFVAIACTLGLAGCSVAETVAANTTPSTPVAPTAATVRVADCALAALPAIPLNALDVRAFGAVPDDGKDDTAAIQAALDALKPDQWLVFPAGRYEHKASLHVRVPGAVMWGEGATLHATNPSDQAVMLQADRASIYKFRLTAVTGRRLHAPWQSRIAVFERVDRPAHLLGNVIRGNRIVEGGAVGTSLANGSSSAGIFVFRADGFLVAENEVRRSLSDGIHVTGGSRNGRVLANTVRETGDDMIAMVSYLGTGDWTSETADRLAPTFASQRDLQLVRNVLVAGNDVEGNYWGRGISVVGGADITIEGNRIARTAVGAGVLLAREASYVTWGVNNVVVKNNRISQIETASPAYVPSGWTQSGFRTGHAGIELHAFVFDDERARPALASVLSVDDILIAGNTVADTAFDGMRIGEGTGVADSMTGKLPDGRRASRAFTGGSVGRIGLSALSMMRTGAAGLAIKSRPTANYNVACEAVTLDGLPISNSACGGAKPAVTGSAMTCLP